MYGFTAQRSTVGMRLDWVSLVRPKKRSLSIFLVGGDLHL